MLFTPSQYALWLAGTAALLSCLTLLIVRRLYRRVPVFTVYIGAAVLGDLASWWLYHRLRGDTAELFRIYWSTEAVLVALRGLVIAEICRRVLRNYRGVWRLGRVVLLALAALLVGAAAAAAWGQSHWIAPLILAAKRGVELAAVGVLVALAALSRYYQIPFPRLEGMLALGLGVYSAIEIVNRTLTHYWIETAFSQWSMVSPAAYVLALSIWLRALARPAGASEPAPAPMAPERYAALAPAVNERLRALNARLEEMLRG